MPNHPSQPSTAAQIGEKIAQGCKQLLENAFNDNRAWELDVADFRAFILKHVGPLAAERDTAKAWAEFVVAGSAYAELVDALCSKSWAGRNDHAKVIALAKRLHDSQATIKLMGTDK